MSYLEGNQTCMTEVGGYNYTSDKKSEGKHYENISKGTLVKKDKGFSTAVIMSVMEWLTLLRLNTQGHFILSCFSRIYQQDSIHSHLEYVTLEVHRSPSPPISPTQNDTT